MTIGGKVSARGYHRREGEGGCVTDDARTYATTRAANRRKQRQTTGAAEGEDAAMVDAENADDSKRAAPGGGVPRGGPADEDPLAA